MRRVYNFSAGPSMLPLSVLKKAQASLNDYNGTGMSVMEIGHRTSRYLPIIKDSEKLLRELLSIPDNYHVLFVQGGAQTQFGAVPLNLLGKTGKADYVQSGHWAKLAIKEAQRYGDIQEAAHVTTENGIPAFDTWKLRADASYLHYTPNETIDGIEFNWVPEASVPLVADMSSNILSKPIDVSQYGVIYAGAQKNMGIAGITCVIVRDDLLESYLEFTPTILQYKAQVAMESMYNTPPTFAWYVTLLMLEWMLDEGGLSVFEQRNNEKAKLLYDFIDSHDFYINKIKADCRSRMNVVFQLADESQDERFLKEAEAAGLAQLKGHRAVGGMRASIYNAMPIEGVHALIDFMQKFVI